MPTLFVSKLSILGQIVIVVLLLFGVPPVSAVVSSSYRSYERRASSGTSTIASRLPSPRAGMNNRGQALVNAVGGQYRTTQLFGQAFLDFIGVSSAVNAYQPANSSVCVNCGVTGQSNECSSVVCVNTSIVSPPPPPTPIAGPYDPAVHRALVPNPYAASSTVYRRAGIDPTEFDWSSRVNRMCMYQVFPLPFVCIPLPTNSVSHRVRQRHKRLMKYACMTNRIIMALNEHSCSYYSKAKHRPIPRRMASAYVQQQQLSARYHSPGSASAGDSSSSMYQSLPFSTLTRKRHTGGGAVALGVRAFNPASNATDVVSNVCRRLYDIAREYVESIMCHERHAPQSSGASGVDSVSGLPSEVVELLLRSPLRTLLLSRSTQSASGSSSGPSRVRHSYVGDAATPSPIRPFLVSQHPVSVCAPYSAPINRFGGHVSVAAAPVVQWSAPYASTYSGGYGPVSSVPHLVNMYQPTSEQERSHSCELHCPPPVVYVDLTFVIVPVRATRRGGSEVWSAGSVFNNYSAWPASGAYAVPSCQVAGDSKSGESSLNGGDSDESEYDWENDSLKASAPEGVPARQTTTVEKRVRYTRDRHRDGRNVNTQREVTIQWTLVSLKRQDA